MYPFTELSELPRGKMDETTACTVREYGNRLTDWRPRCAQHAELYQEVSKDMGTVSSFEMRQWMTKNGDRLPAMQKKRIEDYINSTGLCPTYGKGMPDYKYMVRCDKSSCQRRLVNPKGHGTGYETVPPF